MVAPPATRVVAGPSAAKRASGAGGVTSTRSATVQDASQRLVTGTTFTVLGGICVAHLMNDMIQSILLAIYPLLQVTFQLSFAQIGLITLCYQLAASLLQPWIGHYTDKQIGRASCRERV